MADTRMTLEQVRVGRPDYDPDRLAATTEADIRRHQIEDGEDPDAPVPDFTLVRNEGSVSPKPAKS